MTGKTNGIDYEELLKRSALRQRVVPNVPRWGIDVTISELSAQSLMDIRRAGVGNEEAVAKLTLSAALVYPALSPEKIDELWAASSEPLTYILNAIAEFNRTGEGDSKALEGSFPGEGSGPAD